MYRCSDIQPLYYTQIHVDNITEHPYLYMNYGSTVYLVI